MTKQLLTIEFRYHDAPKGDYGTECKSKTTTIGIFDTIEQAMEAGNNALKVLANHFQVRGDDVFKANFLWGMPKTLVTNTCYPTKGIQYFAKIETLHFTDLQEAIHETFAAYDRYKEYKLAQTE